MDLFIFKILNAEAFSPFSPARGSSLADRKFEWNNVMMLVSYKAMIS